MIMMLIVLGRNAVFKQTGDILFIVCEGEMVKFAFKAYCELEEENKPTSFFITAISLCSLFMDSCCI